MGIKKKSGSELTSRENEITDAGLEETTVSDTTPPPETPGTRQTTPRLSILEAILDKIDARLQLWPKEALKAVLKQFSRMPRCGWDTMHRFYNRKFGLSTSPADFKRKAEAAVVGEQGKRCSREMFSEQIKKKTKTVDELVEENTLQDLKLYQSARDQILKELGNIRTMRVEDVPRTTKIPNEFVDSNLMENLDQALGEIIQKKAVSTWSDLARLLQATQLAYQSIKTKAKAQSTWNESILKKIDAANTSAEVLKKARDDTLKPGKELSNGRKIMRELGLILERKDDIVEAISRLTEKAAVYQKKLDSHERRKSYAKANRKFELYRSRFYRDLGGEPTSQPNDVPAEEVKEFWATMWNKPQDDEEKDFSEYLRDFVPSGSRAPETFPAEAEVIDIIRFLPSWKAAGCDGIYNFFIKRCTSLHATIYQLIKKTCMEEEKAEDWFYKGITYLIPKGSPKKGSDYRPITCMSNLYKLTTKCVTKVMQAVVEQRGLLAENQMGTVRMVQGAKEQAMLNIALNRTAGNNLHTTWIDVKKAFDSVNHGYLIECIGRLNFPAWISKFLKRTIEEWRLSILFNNTAILDKKIERGILQGDSLSPLLFVLCMDPLSRALNAKFPKMAIKTEEDDYVTNHLLFIDDLKLFTEKEENLKTMVEETEKFFNAIGLEVNRAKSATNAEACESSALVLDANQGYKYLGITENRKSEVMRETYERIRAEITGRVKSICKAGLNGRNTIAAINEYALSVVNYYVGIVPMYHEDYQRIDEEVRKILVSNKVHLQPANTERLYLPRK